MPSKTSKARDMEAKEGKLLEQLIIFVQVIAVTLLLQFVTSLMRNFFHSPDLVKVLLFVSPFVLPVVITAIQYGFKKSLIPNIIAEVVVIFIIVVFNLR